MNCQKGDIAYVASSGPSAGVVRQVEHIWPAGFDGWLKDLGPIWSLDQDLDVLEVNFIGASRLAKTWTCPDIFLRPIRGGEGEDEILRIAGKPQEVTA